MGGACGGGWNMWMWVEHVGVVEETVGRESGVGSRDGMVYVAGSE